MFGMPVLGERGQLRRGAHRRQHPVELLLSLAMLMHEHGAVTRGERFLIIGDRIQCMRGWQLTETGAGSESTLCEADGFGTWSPNIYVVSDDCPRCVSAQLCASNGQGQ